MPTRKTIILITTTLVVAFVAATALRFVDESDLGLGDVFNEEGTTREVFTCDLMPEATFTYQVFAGWQIVPGNSSAEDGNVECVLTVTVPETGQPTRPAAIHILKQPYDTPVGAPTGSLANKNGISYEYVKESLGGDVTDTTHYGYVAFYTSTAVYWVQLLGLPEAEFPADEFLQTVIETFAVSE